MFLKEVYQFVILYRDIFGSCPLIGVPLPKLETFSGIFWVLPIDYSRYEKAILGIFVYSIVCKVKTIEVSLCVYKQCSQAKTRLIYE